jgi:hypothetical protein
MPNTKNQHPSEDEEVLPLIRARDACLANAKEYDEIIARLKALRSAPPTTQKSSNVPSIEIGEYKGIPLSQALEFYLKKRPGIRIPVDQVLDDLARGGARMNRKASRKPRHNLKITIANRRDLCSYDPVTDEVWLADTAGETNRRRR